MSCASPIARHRRDLRDPRVALTPLLRQQISQRRFGYVRASESGAGTQDREPDHGGLNPSYTRILVYARLESRTRHPSYYSYTHRPATARPPSLVHLPLPSCAARAPPTTTPSAPTRVHINTRPQAPSHPILSRPYPSLRL
ncbi:hypothetical protein HETIRDRAFT_451635 [Heterobasidion irregulare TC 32-1]|uniref:Uncharacterized protein n=1 Tax=Heterobasidion irregulare (strain TC 32-1) TaxID=747525 RepID=W4KA78_HETIT|nr:uncharacterized protein HETIRDRAFT_451635 [Heterobasidion irregulare TC 32-1]ETW81976.1 hypothetical protein HETIRDRAFT_451635 [Heterobasidion irregulare TC 32-1]